MGESDIRRPALRLDAPRSRGGTNGVFIDVAGVCYATKVGTLQNKAYHPINHGAVASQAMNAQQPRDWGWTIVL